MNIVWLNGELGDTPQLSATSAGWLSGHGVFTTIGIWRGQPFALDLHLQRLRHDVEQVRIPYEVNGQDIMDALLRVIAANEVQHGMARITVAQRGDGRWSTESGSDCLILARPLPEQKWADARLQLSPYRIHSQRSLAGVKSTSYLDYTLAWQHAHQQGYDEVVLLNERERVCEGARSNLFWVREGELYTPALSTGCLPGIARRLVLDWAIEVGVRIHEVEASAQDLAEAESAFITSSVQGVRTVRALAERATDFEDSEIIQRLKHRWEAAVQQPSTL